MPLGKEYLENFAFHWANGHRNADYDTTMAFARWYAETYPGGDKELSKAWDYWIDGGN